MSELDKILDTIMALNAELIRQEAPNEDKKELLAALRESKKRQIISEIRNEYKQEIISDANEEIAKKVNRQKLREIKSLILNGFILAFIVGLAVNQVTELLGFWKGTVTNGSREMTILFTIVFMFICLITYSFLFISKAISLFDELKKDKK